MVFRRTIHFFAVRAVARMDRGRSQCLRKWNGDRRRSRLRRSNELRFRPPQTMSPTPMSAIEAPNRSQMVNGIRSTRECRSMAIAA
jgi:hypothetical protein